MGRICPNASDSAHPDDAIPNTHGAIKDLDDTGSLSVHKTGTRIIKVKPWIMFDNICKEMLYMF
jgi:hypothetical protein